MKNKMLKYDYYVLAHNDEKKYQDLENISDYEFGDYDLTELWKGKEINPIFPKSLKIYLEGNGVNDYPGCPFSWLIVSRRFWEIMQPMIEKDVQLINDVPIYKVDKKAKSKDYVLVNPLIQYNNKSNKSMNKYEVLTDIIKLPKDNNDVHIFTHEKQPGTIYITKNLANSLPNNSSLGIALIPCIPIE